MSTLDHKLSSIYRAQVPDAVYQVSRLSPLSFPGRFFKGVYYKHVWTWWPSLPLDRASKLYFLCSTQLSTKFILLMNVKMLTIYPAHNVKMSTIVGILTFISRKNTSYESLKARNTYLFQRFSFYEQLKFYAQLS